METIIAYLDAMPFWAWLALGVALLTIEVVVVPTTFLLWPGAAALVVGTFVALPPHLNWWGQLLTFAVLTTLFAWMGPKMFPRYGNGQTDAPKLNRRAEQYLGRVVAVAEDFRNGRGRVRVDDTLWSAVAEDGGDYTAGTAVEIVQVESALMTVRAKS